MKLYVSPTSPYARKARVLLREKALQDRVEEVFINPHQDPSELLARNPLGKIPALALDDGSALYDSPVICEYLDALDATPSLIPPDGEARWTVLRAQALADGIMDMAVATIMERARPNSDQSPGSMTRWREKIERAVAGIGEAVAGTRGEHPELIDWHASLRARHSMEETAPPRGYRAESR